MFHDKEYLHSLLKIGLPIAAQNLVSNLLSAVSVLLIGQLGDAVVAAVGLANQIFFLMNLMVFGMVSGGAIFTAQFWGRGDEIGIRKVTALSMGMAIGAGVLFSIVALIFPRQALGLYSQDPAVIELGAQYLQIIGFSYVAFAVTVTLGTMMRFTGSVRPPMIVSLVSLGLGTALSYALIFGMFGLPAMGIRGAALGACIARLLECAILLWVTYSGRYSMAVRLADFRTINGAFVRRFLVTALPVAANETIWSLGVSIYNVVYAHISTEAITAMNITGTIEGIAFALPVGLANASAIMIGSRIGAGDETRAYSFARRALTMGFITSALIGASVLLLSGAIVASYKISAGAAFDTRSVLAVSALTFWIRANNLIMIVGVLRSGGDTRFSALLDVGTVWVVGIPMALLGAFALHLPIYWVFAMVLAEELTKFIIGYRRFFTRRWINNVAIGMH